MTLTISDTTMASDQSDCTARRAPDRNGWEVSWLPGRTLDRNAAITAMVLADTVGSGARDRGHRLWPFVEAWAAELGLSAPDALSRVSQPRESGGIAKDPSSERADPEAAGS
jgi:hypothetical protein